MLGSMSEKASDGTVITTASAIAQRAAPINGGEPLHLRTVQSALAALTKADLLVSTTALRKRGRRYRLSPSLVRRGESPNDRWGKHLYGL